jgi:PAS domain S-box-containing protein
LYYLDIFLLILSAGLGLFLSFYIFLYRKAPGSQALSILILGASLWSLGYAFELLASSLTYKLFWEKIEFFGIVIIPLAWFVFVAQFLGYPKWMKRILDLKILLVIIPVVTLILVWTNDLHNLIWQSVQMYKIGPLVTLDFVRGPWFWVLMSFSYLLLLWGSVMLIISLFSIVRLQRWQVFLTLLAILLPWVGNVLYISGISPEHFLDWTAFLFLFSGVLFSISLFRFQLVNILPIAQEAVFAGLIDDIIVLDLSNRIVEMNPSARAMTGIAGGDPLGKDISKVMPELMGYIDRAGMSKKYRSELDREEKQEMEFYDLHINLLSDPYSNPIGRLVVLHRITQLKQYQTDLERSRDRLETVVSERTDELRQVIKQLQDELIQRSMAEKRFKDVIEAAPEAMVVLDQNGRILLVNAMAERLFGYEREELLGLANASDLIPARYREKEWHYLLDFSENPTLSQSSFGLDLFAVRKDGGEFPMEADVSRLDTAEGYWIAINLRDISERKMAETALKESEETYRALFENAGDAIFLTNLEGKILKVNQKANELLGFSASELESLSILDITASEELEDVRKNMEQLLRGIRLQPYIRHYLKKSGESLPTENNTVLVTDGSGTPRYFQNICRDITERIQAEEDQLQLLEEIRRSNVQMRNIAMRLQEVEELERQELATVLHDRVGQNLTGLNLNLKILQNQLNGDTEPEIHKRLEDSLRMVEETTHKIRDVMADLNPPILDEYGLMAAIKWYSNDFANRTRIVTKVAGDRSDLELDIGVQKILFRLIQESLNNVAKHAQANQVEITVTSEPEYVKFTVKDDGIGFNIEENKKTSFEPHWGLLSMQQRAATIGAELVINSSPGSGTEVCIRIRRNKHDD